MANVIAFGQRLAGRMVQVGGQATGRREHWGREEEMASWPAGQEGEGGGRDIRLETTHSPR